jgi:hypothetical protein
MSNNKEKVRGFMVCQNCGHKHELPEPHFTSGFVEDLKARGLFDVVDTHDYTLVKLRTACNIIDSLHAEIGMLKMGFKPQESGIGKE